MTQPIQGSSAHKRYLEQDQLYFEGPATKTQKVEGVCEDSQLVLSGDRQGKELSAHGIFSNPKMVELLLSYLSRAELGRARRVCKLFRKVIEESQMLQTKVLIGEAINIAKSETGLIQKALAFLSIVQVDSTTEIIEETKKSLKALNEYDSTKAAGIPYTIFKVKFANFVKSVAICDIEEAKNTAKMFLQNSYLQEITVFAYQAIYKVAPSEDLFNEVSSIISTLYPELIRDCPDVVWVEYIEMFAAFDLEKAKNYVAGLTHKSEYFSAANMKALAELIFVKKKFSESLINQAKTIPNDFVYPPTRDQVLFDIVKIETGRSSLDKATQTAREIDDYYIWFLAWIEIIKKTKNKQDLNDIISYLPKIKYDNYKPVAFYKINNLMLKHEIFLREIPNLSNLSIPIKISILNIKKYLRIAKTDINKARMMASKHAIEKCVEELILNGDNDLTEFQCIKICVKVLYFWAKQDLGQAKQMTRLIQNKSVRVMALTAIASSVQGKPFRLSDELKEVAGGLVIGRHLF